MWFTAESRKIFEDLGKCYKTKENENDTNLGIKRSQLWHKLCVEFKPISLEEAEKYAEFKNAEYE